MKILLHSKHALLVFVFAAWLHNLPSLYADTPESEGAGASTNGIYASACYTHSTLRLSNVSPDWIQVFYHFSPPSTNIPFISPFGGTVGTNNGHIFHMEPFDYALYFSAPSLLCGPMQLLDSSSNQIPSLNTNLNSEAAYPSQYSLSLVRHNLNIGRLNPLEPVGITGTGLGYGFARFSLPDRFKIEKPGDYQLTVWPKIYKRSETDRDLVERIDLPPVTIPIHWKESSH